MKRILCGVLVVPVALLAGCRQDMHNQPKEYPQRGSVVFADGRSVRSQVAGTLARSQDGAAAFPDSMASQAAAYESAAFPLQLNLAVLERGREQYNVYCSPCHSRVGNGKGVLTERGYYNATSMHSERLRTVPLGHFVSVMSLGYGAMPDYSAQVSLDDRWAIAAYIRALQLSQHAAEGDLGGKQPVSLKKVMLAEGFSQNFLEDWLHTSPRVAVPASAVAAPVAVQSVVATADEKPAVNVQEEKSNAAVHAAQQTAAAEAPAKPAMVAGNSKKGEQVYMANCAMCHQLSRQGMPPMIPSLIGIVGRDGEKKIKAVAKDGIPDGKPPMPPHPNLTDEDLENLLAYLRAK